MSSRTAKVVLCTLRRPSWNHATLLKSIYRFVCGEELVGSHKSLNVAKSQTCIVGSTLFFDFLDKTKLITTILMILSQIRPVHSPWVELEDDDNKSM